MRPRHSHNPRNLRLALLATTIFICCALIGAPAISSVERSPNIGHGAKAMVAGSRHAKKVVGSSATQSLIKDKKDPASLKESVDEVFEIPYDGPMPPARSFGRGASAHSAVAATATSVTEVEPNNTTGTAQALPGTSHRVRGNLFPNGDIDFYSFTAAAGDRFYAATMTSFSAGSSTDSQITLIGSDGTTVIEFDDDNGSFAGLSSSIAGATIPTAGTYFVKVNDFTAGTTSERPYELWLQVQSGSPTPEVEGNDTPATANPLPASGWVSGTRNPAAATEQDWFSMTLAAGDTVYLGLDLDPERDGVVWNGRLGIALFGDAGNQILVVDDAGTGDVTPNPNIPSEALFMTVKDAGTYYAFVDSASAAVGGPTATYHLNVTVLPRVPVGVNCTTYTSADVPKTIGPGAGLVSSTITIPGNPRIASMRVFIDLNHALMADCDVHLRSPAGNDNGLFTDIGASATGGQTQMNLAFDDLAGIPPSFTVLKGLILKPELAYRLGWFTGENAGGTWTLDIRDDTAGANGGTLNGWSIEICEEPAAPLCTGGGAQTTVFSTDFEANDGGFTHSGTADEWARGTPATPATSTANPVAGLSTANSGVNAWKTDLTGTYNVSSNQDLFSPNINLATFVGPITLTWAQWYQMESASFDHMFVEVQEVGGGMATRKVFEWLDATMTDSVGNPTVNVPASSGWSLRNADISDFAGKLITVRFHLDSDNTVNFAGLAIDDVSVKACPAVVACVITCPANITTKPNDPGQCGAIVTYSAPTSVGACGTITCSPGSGSFFPVGTTTVTCKSNNGAGPEMCSFTVSVQDTEAPAITCPANMSVSQDQMCGKIVNYTTPTPTDNCPMPTASCAPPSGTCFPVGTTTVTCTAKDASNNMSMCTFTITVSQCTLTCPANQTRMNDPNQCGAVVTYPAPTTTGSCGSVTCSPASGSFFAVGTTTVTCKSNGGAGPETCTFTVTVNDTQPPVITCPANITTAAAATCPLGTTSGPVNFTVTATDNCPGVTVACKNQNNQAVTSGQTFPVGTTTVTCTATDASNNTASCSFTVTVFSGCVQDDGDPTRVALFNAQTGQYRICCGGTVFTGTGTVTVRGCLVSITHNPADRRVQITSDGNAGSASLQFPPGTMKCTIQDRNVRNNSCVCQ